ncbi:MAG: hypothetical protein N3B10_09905 [Armatimonadetes bacterium]|nr:hypothetical protein [Armatimonadota bacterium]MCX7968781.1 hypothetical protein [Armatimonadota bacterium]MDW8144089.1 hypothetical protein [Armatimonadota bacterium]
MKAQRVWRLPEAIALDIFAKGTSLHSRFYFSEMSKLSRDGTKSKADAAK